MGLFSEAPGVEQSQEAGQIGSPDWCRCLGSLLGVPSVGESESHSPRSKTYFPPYPQRVWPNFVSGQLWIHAEVLPWLDSPGRNLGSI